MAKRALIQLQLHTHCDPEMSAGDKKKHSSDVYPRHSLLQPCFSGHGCTFVHAVDAYIDKVHTALAQ